jgi:predicted nucleotidyltransferase
MSGKSFESEPGKESLWELSQISVPFGPLGLIEGIPSSVFAPPDGQLVSFEGCEEILELVNKMYDDPMV